MNPRRVVITGIGVVSPIGLSRDTFWRNALSGVCSVEKVPSHWAQYASYQSAIWAPLPQIDFSRWNISRVEQMQNDKSTMIAWAAATEAMQHAQLPISLVNEKKSVWRVDLPSTGSMGVYCGTGVGGVASLIGASGNHLLLPVRENLQQIISSGPQSAVSELNASLRIPPRFNPFIVSMMMPNATSSTTGIRFSLKGPNTTFCCACAAGTVAIGNAFRAVQSGAVDCMLAGGAEYLGDDYGGVFRGFDGAKTLARAGEDPSRANRPFDAKRTGFLFGEGGGAFLVLEELDHARRRQAPVVAEIAAYAESFDAYNVMMMEPSGTAIEQMVAQALDMADVRPADVDYINTHGTGTLANDETESAVIERMFGEKPLVNATKGLTGHTIGASGAIEAAVTAMSISESTTHPCVNLDDPIRPLHFVKKAQRFEIRTAISQSFAFGGHNAVLVMKDVDR